MGFDNGRCDRCFEKTISLTGSYFNTEMICPACAKEEREDPRFEDARRAEHEAVRRGDYNFPGIGR